MPDDIIFGGPATQGGIYDLVFQGFSGEVEACDDLDCVERVLTNARDSSASPENLISILASTKFGVATEASVDKAIQGSYINYLAYLIMAEHDGRSIALSKDQISNVKNLLSYAYKKPWCSLEHWRRRAGEFGVDLTAGDNVDLFQDVLQEEKDIPSGILEKLKSQLQWDLTDKLALYNAMEILKWILKEEKVELLDLDLMVVEANMEMLSLLIGNDLLQETFGRSFSKDSARTAVFRAVNANNPQVANYFASRVKPRFDGLINKRVSAETLKELDGNVLKGYKFENLDLNGVKTLLERVPDYEHITQTILYSIGKNDNSELEAWALENPQYLREPQGWLDVIIFEKFDFVKELRKRHGFMPAQGTLWEVYREGRLDIVKWWMDEQEEDIIASLEGDIMHAKEQILDLIYEKYSMILGPKLDDLIEKGAKGDGDYFKFIKWAHNKVVTVPLKVEQRMEWSESPQGALIQEYIRDQIKKGKFNVLAWAMEHPELYPDEDFIKSLDTTLMGSKDMTTCLQEYYHHAKNGSLEECLHGPAVGRSTSGSVCKCCQ